MRATLGLVIGVQAIALIAGILDGVWWVVILACIGVATVLKLARHIEVLTSEIDRTRDRLDELATKKAEERTESLLKLVQQYEHDALTDPLTGLFNRRGGEDAIIKNVARSRRVKTAISFVLIDLDHFKHINDTHGHAMGDIVLCTVARTITVTLRTADIPIRWGGEELLVCLPDTDLEGAVCAAEKIRSAIEELVFADGLKVTASFGCAEMGTEELHVTLARADMQLYIAKSRGRNCVFPKYP